MVVKRAVHHPKVESGLTKSRNNMPSATDNSEYVIMESNTPVDGEHRPNDDNQTTHGASSWSKTSLHFPTPLVRPPPPSVPGQDTCWTGDSAMAILGGSGVHQAQTGHHFGKSAVDNSCTGSQQFQSSHSSFLPSSSALSRSFHPSMSNSSLMRPSRQLNKAELYELKDSLWKASMSSGFGATVVDPNDCGHIKASGQLPFYTQFFDMSGTMEKYLDNMGPPQPYDDIRPSSMAFMPLPRESVAMVVDAVRASALDDDEKCRFLFEMFDVDNRGVLSKEGVRAFVEATFAANGVEFLGEFDYDAVVDKVFAQCRDRDQLTYNEFKNVFGDLVAASDDAKSKQEIGKLSMLSVAADAQREKQAVVDQHKNGRWYGLQKSYRKHKNEIFWVTLYLLFMVAVFVAKAVRFSFDPAVGNCPRIAKGFAQICMVNTFCVLLPMCRNFVTGLRTLPVVVNYVPMDQHIEFHKICGVVMLVASVGHTAAWLAIVYYVRTVSLVTWEASAYHHLSFVRDENLFSFALRLPIWTGLVMLLCAGIATPLCLPRFRRGSFNAFWLSHMLFIPFLVLMAVHGLAQWLAAPEAYGWILPPIVIYLIEKRYRMAHVFGGRTTIANVQISKEAVAVFMRKPKDFGKRQRFQPGMYLFVNVPSISQFEWHPFTISSAPEDDFLSLHIQKAGDWTGALYDNLENLKKTHEEARMEAQGGDVVSPYPVVYLDGPVGAPAQDYARYREVVLIGAGIGVTPFASILRSILHQWESYRCPHCKEMRFPPNFQLHKIYFYWVTREQKALTWFTNTMNQLSELDTENRLEIHNFFTSVKNESVVAPLRALQTFIHNTEGQDIVSGLQTKQKTHFGRPDWKVELSRVASNHRRLEPLAVPSDEREEIGVFFCGPKPLGNLIYEQCTLLNQEKVRRTPDVAFDFHSENF